MLSRLVFQVQPSLVFFSKCKLYLPSEAVNLRATLSFQPFALAYIENMPFWVTECQQNSKIVLHDCMQMRTVLRNRQLYVSYALRNKIQWVTCKSSSGLQDVLVAAIKVTNKPKWEDCVVLFSLQIFYANAWKKYMNPPNQGEWIHQI